jgi:uncharacterized protein (DUF58 family)
MIVPRARLLWWAGLIVLPLATVGAVVPAVTLPAVAWIAALFALAALDAVLAYGRLDGIGVELPEVVRLSKDRPGAIELRIENESMRAMRLRVGLAFPREILSPDEDMLVALPEGSALARLTWACTPVRRGSYFFSVCYLEGASPMGFWAVRAAVPARMELRVYPNLLTEQKNVAALFLNRGSFGIHAQRQVGKGREFEKLREYIPGDSSDEIHWKATAKRGHPVTKVFQIERTQEVYVIIDASRLSARSPGVATGAGILPATTLERFITAALILGLAAERQGDLFGLLTFTDKVEHFVRARNGKAHYSACRDAIYALQPQIVTPDFDELCTFIRLRLRRRALLVFLTELDDPVLAESFVRNMDLICRQHLVLVNMLQPAGARPLFSNTNVASLDALYQNLGGHVLWHSLRELEKVLQRRGVRFSLLDNEKLSAQLVSQYISIKQRQIL